MDFWTLLALAQAGAALRRADDNSLLHLKGSVLTVADLPTDAANGDVYHVDEDGGEYAFNGNDWESLGPLVVVDDELSTSSRNPVENRVVTVAINKAMGEEMTLAQYNALTLEQKMDGTVRYITDVNTLPSAAGVSF